MKTIVVFIHGLWVNGAEGLVLRRRLARDLNAEERTFSYRSVTASLNDNAAAFGAFLASLHADALHVVGHSLGGVVTLKLFDNPPALPPGRIVLLGSPVGGSRAAQNFAKIPFGARILGLSIRQAAQPAQVRGWRGARDLGIIAGTRPLGMGRLVTSFDGPSDGTVSVAETHLPGATDELAVPVNHTGLVFSGLVARQTAAFLRDGRFVR